MIAKKKNLQTKRIGELWKGSRRTLDPCQCRIPRSTPWFALDARDYSKEEHITVHLSRNFDEFIVESPDGVGAVLLGRPGSISTAVPMDWSKPAANLVTVNAKDFVKDLKGEKP